MNLLIPKIGLGSSIKGLMIWFNFGPNWSRLERRLRRRFPVLSGSELEQVTIAAPGNLILSFWPRFLAQTSRVKHKRDNPAKKSGIERV